MKNLFLILMFLSLIIFNIGCEDVPEDQQVLSKTSIPDVEDNSPIIEPEVVEPEIIPEFSHYSLAIPIDEEVDFYFFTDTKALWKFKGTKKEIVKISIVKNYKNVQSKIVEFTPYEFFNRDGYWYFSWMIREDHYDNDGNYVPDDIHWFKQKDGIVEELTDHNYFGRTPEVNFGTYKSDNFELIIGVWEEKPVSDINNLYLNKPVCRFLKIFGVYEITNQEEELLNGLFFNVIESGRESVGAYTGLYFVSKYRQSPSKILEKGRLWIK